MADLYNSQRILGIRLQAEGATMHNSQRTIGIAPVADGVTFSGDDRSLGIAMLGADQPIYNDQPVIGGVLINDGRTMYNGQPVVPVAVRSGAVFDFLAGSASGGSQTFTRSSAAWRYDETGALVSTAIDVLRADHDVTTLAPRGVILEPASTNGVRNSSAGGASAGTPGTKPTNWTLTATSAGVSSSVIGTGTEEGIPYIDFRFAGTASGTASFFMNFDAPTQIVAATGETWTASLYHRLISGALTGVTVQIACAGFTAAGVSTADQGVATIVPTTAALKTQRAGVAKTFAVGTTARMLPFLYVAVANTTVADFTIRVALPQGEQKSTYSTVIPTTSAAITRAADVLTLTPADAGALTWRVRYDDNSEGTLATGVTGAYAVDPATLSRARVKAIWATP